MLAKTPHRATDPRLVYPQLGEMLKHLQQIQSAVVVAVAALRHQNCELDTDISNVLQRCVADRIQDQIERLEAMSERRRRVGPGGRGGSTAALKRAA
jgi:hypothetical protein